MSPNFNKTGVALILQTEYFNIWPAVIKLEQPSPMVSELSKHKSNTKHLP